MPVDNVAAKEILNLLLLDLQLIVVLPAPRFGLVPWIKLELGVYSLKVHPQQYWPCPIDSGS